MRMCIGASLASPFRAKDFAEYPSTAKPPHLILPLELALLTPSSSGLNPSHGPVHRGNHFDIIRRDYQIRSGSRSASP